MKKQFYILIILLGITFTSFAQAKISTDPAQAKLIKYYPNPATTSINFDFIHGYNKSYSLLVFNFMGKLVYDLKNLTPKSNIRLDEFYRGIFIFQLRDKNGSILETGKFQVIK